MANKKWIQGWGAELGTDGGYIEPLIDKMQEKLSGLDAIWNPPPSPYADQPAKWIKDVLSEFIWSKQREICQSVVDNRYTAVRSCHGAGKSYIASRIIAWWLATHEDAFVVTTAPTAHQVKTILWREIKRAHKKGKLGGTITEGPIPEWKIGGELVAFGRKPADYIDPDEAASSFQGIHALHVLVVLDEAAGIPEWLANAVETLITNERSRVLAIGNPTNPASWFAKINKPGQGYNRIKIAWKDTPNYKTEDGEYQEDVPAILRELLISEIWVQERGKRWGESSPMYVSRVLAEFPDVSDDTLFSPAIIAIGIACDKSRAALQMDGLGNCGFDIARYGVDESVIYHNKNGYVRMIARWGKADTVQTVGNYKRLWWEEVPDKAPTTQIDITGGLGAGPYDQLRHQGYPVVPFTANEKAYHPLRYRNRRAEAYWEAKELMEIGEIDIEELDEDLQAELMEIKFDYDGTGRIFIEPKEDVKDRIGHSPDRADAFVMSLQQGADWQRILGAGDPDRSTDPDNPDPPPKPPDEDDPEALTRDLMDILL